MQTPTIICYGEVLWDLLPTGKMAGGAPMNVAYHTQNLGLQSFMISKIGTDELGKELMNFLETKSVDTSFIQTDDVHTTGKVMVHLDEGGSPSYEIIQPVAWDFIEPADDAIAMVQQSAALVFGSLACRSERSRQTLLQLIPHAKLRVLDVNLRSPFYSKEILEPLLSGANIIKVNEEELREICGWYGAEEEDVALIHFLVEKFGPKTIIVTMGADGVLCYDQEKYYFQSGLKIEVKDTVGSGDSFLAGFLSKYLLHVDIQQCLAFANGIGALVATKRGGTPELSQEEISAFMESNNR